MVVVNGRWISPSFTTTGVAGGDSYVQMEFPDRSSRKIKIITSGANQIRNIQTESAYAPVKAAAAGTLLVCDGDSLSAGSGSPPDGASALDTWPQATATMLGFDHCCNASIGGTKWVASGAGDVAVSHFGGGRLTTALTLTPDAFVYAGSRNDSAVDQTALDAITSAVETALDATTVTKKFVMGTFTVLSQNAAVQAGAVAKSVPFIDMQQGLQASDIGADTIHPTYQGAVNLRNRIVPALRSAGCVP
jgi:lysophospholipase L1-like esterase